MRASMIRAYNREPSWAMTNPSDPGQSTADRAR